MKSYLFLGLFIWSQFFSFAQEKKMVSEEPFRNAVDEITDMLHGEKELSFKRAVFLVENAYYEDNLSWNDFCLQIDSIVSIAKKMIAAKGLQQYKTAGNWAVFSYMSEKIPENNFTPFTYDYENFMGDKDYESCMVFTLLKNRKGNCRSLPYLYKILADELGVEAFIAKAPMHNFIKHRDENARWWNLEMTSGSFSRTSFIIESFNVSDAGMESGLYMKPLSNEESVASCFIDLIEFYAQKTGCWDGEIVCKAYTEGLKVYPNSMLQILKMDEIKSRLDKAMAEKGIFDYDLIDSHPDLVELWNEIAAVSRYLVQIGYSDLTPEQYEQKIREVQALSEKEKNEKQK